MSNFNKYFQVQSRKMISAYGGVGSIVETTKGAIIIQDFDKWYFFLSDSHKGDDYRIDDFRLLQRLKYHFPNLSALIRIPANTESPNAYSVPQDEKKIASGKYFPEWFYCNNCESFKHIKDWWTDWKTDLQRFGYTNDRAKESFRPPKCNECFKKAKAYGGKKLYFELEQVRFIMTAPNGEICDIPWERWITAEKGIKEDDSHSGSIKVDYDNLCCDNPKLKYLKSSTFEDYSGIRIKCASCKKENSLAGLFGFRKSFFGDKSILFKPVIRTSNSVYYPVIINSIYLPAKKTELSDKITTTIRTLYESENTVEDICKILKLEEEAVKQVLNLQIEFEKEIRYRLKEFDFITQNPNFKDDSNLTYENEDVKVIEKFGVSKLIKIKRLKLTSVQTGYTRQEPYDKDEFIKQGDILKIQYTSKQIKPEDKKGKMTEFLPAIESFGEGIFIEMDKEKLSKWFDKYWSNNPEFKKRLMILQNNIAKSEFVKDKQRFSSNSFLGKFVLLHTLSHILIKELEFLCGYPTTSISERLYVDNDNMQGILLYTIAGSEGSYGGLISQSSSDKFAKILESALFRAGDCASDPICCNSESQGVGGLNLSACYSCCLLPENSCEEFNSYLDRNLLINPDYGFFVD